MPVFPPCIYIAEAFLRPVFGALSDRIGFAHLADTTPPERMGRTMGSAELGRELGDAGGPLLVGGTATLIGLPAGLGALAVLVAVAGVPRLARGGPGTPVDAPRRT